MRYAALRAACALFFVIGFGNASRQSRAAPPATLPAAMETAAGIFRSDRGDYHYVARYWPLDGAPTDEIAKSIGRAMDAADALEGVPERFDDLAALHTGDSLPFLKFQENQLKTSPLFTGNPNYRRPDLLLPTEVTHLVMVTGDDANGLCFARLVVNLHQAVLMPSARGSPQLIEYLIRTPVLRAARVVNGRAQIDLAEDEHPIFEAIKFSEWDRFGLPNPAADQANASARARDGTVATKRGRSNYEALKCGFHIAQ